MLKVKREDQLGWHRVRLIESTYDKDLGAILEHLVEEKTFMTKRGTANWINAKITDYAVSKLLVEV